MRTPQHIQPHSNFTFPVHSDKLPFESGKRPFYYFHGIAGSQWGAAHFHRFGTVVEHEAEPVHLFVGDDGGSAFAAQYHIAADRLQAQGERPFLRSDMHEYHHGNHKTVYPFAAVAPLANLALDGQVALDAHSGKPLCSLFLKARLYIGHQPLAGCCIGFCFYVIRILHCFLRSVGLKSMPGSSALLPQHTSKQTKNKPGNKDSIACRSPRTYGVNILFGIGGITVAIPVAISVFLTVAVVPAILAVTVVIAVFSLGHVQAVDDGT